MSGAKGKQVETTAAPVDRIETTLDNAVHLGPAQPFMLESASFYDMVNTQRDLALKAIEMIERDIGRLDVEIAMRRDRLTDLHKITDAAEAVLTTINRPAPKIEEREGEQ